MNTFRRKELNNIAKELTVLREKLEAVYEDEYEAYNNMSKGLQNLGRGQTMREYLCDIEDDIRGLVAIEENLNQIAERQSK